MEGHRQSFRSGLVWNCLFVLPFWLQTVWHHLGGKGQPYIISVADGSRLIGLAPLSIDGHTAYFLGNPEVCDYQDIVTVAGRETEVMDAVGSHLRASGVQQMDLKTLHPDAVALKALRALELQSNRVLSVEPDDVTYETTLPASWDDYLKQMNGKQRHEVRRKMRRLESSGSVAYRLADKSDTLENAIDQFLRLFQTPLLLSHTLQNDRNKVL